MNTLKIKKTDELFNYLTSQLNFRSYGLDEGFEQFDSRVMSTQGSCRSDAIEWHTFEWRDDFENDVTVEIAFVSNPLDEEGHEFEDYYLVRGELKTDGYQQLVESLKDFYNLTDAAAKGLLDRCFYDHDVIASVLNRAEELMNGD